jgi:hypothetical protein
VIVTRRIAAARCAAVVVLALVAAGCTSSHSKAAPDFKSGYQAVERDYRNQFAALQTEAQGVVGKDLATQLTVFAKMTGATKRARDRLRTLAPPAKVRAAYHRLVASLGGQQVTLRQIQASARDNDQAGLNNSLSEYASALQDGISLLRQIDDALGSKIS